MRSDARKRTTAEAEVPSMAEVLAEHAIVAYDPSACRCACQGAGATWLPHATYRAHVTQALTAAGFGHVAAVEALHGNTHWCFDADGQALVYEPDTEWWPCPTLAALVTEAGERDE